MPWLTPDSIPEDDDCRPLSIPADTVWLSLVSGALTELTKPYNWQKFGTLTVQETVDKMQAIIDSYYSSPCAMCMTPGGYRVTRISPSGHVEQLDPSGDWVDATDEYHIPPPSARTEGDPPDQICLAAKNAVNVLAQLYENLTDSWNSNLDDAEAVTAFILGAIALVGFEFAPITWSIVAFMTPVFAALYSALEYLGADLWTEAVSDQITCFLVDCASNDAGVVTFDWDCFMGNLNSLTDTFGLTEEQLRLYLQIAFMLYFIGGVDGLNLAGRTTEITDDDCPCDNAWCYVFADGDRLDDWLPGYWVHGGGETSPSYSGGFWHAGVSPSRISYINLYWEFDPPITITDAAIIGTDAPQTGGGQGIYINGDDPAAPFGGTTATLIWNYDAGYIPGTYTGVESITICLRSLDQGMPDFTLGEMQFSGEGDNPFGDDNC